MKKEYIILVVLIIALSAYLVLKKENRRNYTLPKIESIETSQVDRVSLKKGDLDIEFNRTGKNWAITKEEYPAQKSAVTTMLDAAKNLNISALVSEKQDMLRYELDEKNAIAVTLFNGEEKLLAFKIGKTAPSFNHTFLMLNGDTRIYHADNSFRSDFDKTVADFRDKTVLTFERDTITKMAFEKKGKTITLIPEESKDDKGETHKSWKATDESFVDKEAVSKLLSSLSSLNCDNYLEDKTKQDLEKDAPSLKISLENEGPIVLNLFDQDGEEKFYATSSMNDYAVELSSFEAKDIHTQADKLLGIEEIPEEDKEQATTNTE